ncbi:hypothetical protein [Albidovulum sp.]|uniref:hypothetical protein n=1 Tax=Albidovulum sp. TaxID=1872424 RepID=UPI0039B8F7AD
MEKSFFTPGRLAIMLGTAALLAAMPVKFGFGTDSGLIPVKAAQALAKGGSDDSGGDDNGGGGHGNDDNGDDDNGGDDNGGNSGGDDDGSDSGDDDGSTGSGDDDGSDSGDDDGSTGSGDDSSSSDGSTGGTGDGSGVTKIESSSAGIEVTYGDGSREEIEGGRYEMKNAAGRTVEERPATQADIDRLLALR